VVVYADHGLLPHNIFALDVSDSDDDHPVAFAMWTAEVLGLPPAISEGIVKETSSWAVRAATPRSPRRKGQERRTQG